MNLSPFKKVSNYNGGPITKASPYWYAWLVTTLEKHTCPRTVLYERVGKESYKFSCPKFGLFLTIKRKGLLLTACLYEKETVSHEKAVPEYLLIKELTVSLQQMQCDNAKLLISFIDECCHHLTKDTYLSSPDFKKTLVSETRAEGVEYICCLIKNSYVQDGEFYVETRNECLSTVKITHGLAPAATAGSWILINKAGKMYVVSAFDFMTHFEKVK